MITRFAAIFISVLAIAAGAELCSDKPAPGKPCAVIGEEATASGGERLKCETNPNTGKQYWRNYGISDNRNGNSRQTVAA